MRALALVIAALAAPPAARALRRPLGSPEADTLVAEASLTFEVAR